ncbi:MAG: alpha/beta fold hydrolase [bacterium]
MGIMPRKVESLNTKPFFHERGPIGCLLIHGFTGAPTEMALLGEFLAERNITASGIQLAGHGTLPDDMAKTTWHDWAASAEQGLEELRGRCKEVFVAGLSMGGALTLYLAARHELPGAVSMAGAAIVNDWRLKLMPLARPFIRYVPKGASVDLVDQSAIGHFSCYDYVSLDSVQSLIEFTGVVREGLPKVKCPLVVLHGLQDKTVPKVSSQYIFDNVGSGEKELVWLERSGHGIPCDTDKQIAFDKTIGMIRRHTKYENTIK